MVVTGPITAQLTLARQSSANNSYNEVHGNQPYHSSADSVACTDGKTHGWTPSSGEVFILVLVLPKEHLQWTNRCRGVEGLSTCQLLTICLNNKSSGKVKTFV